LDIITSLLTKNNHKAPNDAWRHGIICYTHGLSPLPKGETDFRAWIEKDRIPFVRNYLKMKYNVTHHIPYVVVENNPQPYHRKNSEDELLLHDGIPMLADFFTVLSTVVPNGLLQVELPKHVAQLINEALKQTGEAFGKTFDTIVRALGDFLEKKVTPFIEKKLLGTINVVKIKNTK